MLPGFKTQQTVIINCGTNKREKSLLREHNIVLKYENPWYMDFYFQLIGKDDYEGSDPFQRLIQINEPNHPSSTQNTLAMEHQSKFKSTIVKMMKESKD